MDAQLIVVTGPPGAGKTTVARLLAAQLLPAACVLESDWWWTTIVNGRIPPWEREAHDQNRTVVRSFAAAASVMAAGGYPTVLEGIIGPWMIDLVMAEAKAHPALTDTTVVEQLWRQFSALGGYERHVLDNSALSPEQAVERTLSMLVDGVAGI